jgi:DMSO reductase anchor subunit
MFTETANSLGNPAILSFILVITATTASFLHLGNPSNAPIALNNLPGSWLSREILAIGVYSLSLLLVLVSGWKTGNPVHMKSLLSLCSISGLALLWMMVRVYTLPTVPAWNNWYTPLSFVSTTVCLGLLSYLVLSPVEVGGAGTQWVATAMVLLLVILCAELVSGFLHQYQLEKMNSGIDVPVFHRGNYHRIHLARMAMLLIAILLTLVIVFKPGLLPADRHYTLLFPLSALLIAQELTGRLLFYSSYFRIGV